MCFLLKRTFFMAAKFSEFGYFFPKVCPIFVAFVKIIFWPLCCGQFVILVQIFNWLYPRCTKTSKSGGGMKGIAIQNFLGQNLSMLCTYSSHVFTNPEFSILTVVPRSYATPQLRYFAAMQFWIGSKKLKLIYVLLFIPSYATC